MTEQEKQTVAAAKEFGVSDLTQDLVRIIDRLDKQQEKILALLGRWIEQFSFPDLSCSPAQGYYQQEIINDTKQLLKEAKEVKDE